MQFKIDYPAVEACSVQVNTVDANLNNIEVEMTNIYQTLSMDSSSLGAFQDFQAQRQRVRQAVSDAIGDLNAAIMMARQNVEDVDTSIGRQVAGA